MRAKHWRSQPTTEFKFSAFHLCDLRVLLFTCFETQRPSFFRIGGAMNRTVPFLGSVVLIPALVVLFLAAFSFADEPNPFATTSRATARNESEDESSRDRSVKMSLKLADRLEEAGRAEEAKRVRDEVRELVIKEDLIARKAAEVEALQGELEMLRRLTGESQTVKIRLLALSVDRTRLGDLAEEFDQLFPILLKAAPAENQTDAEAAKVPVVPVWDLQKIRTDSPLFTELKRRHAIQFLADPTLVTTNLYPAAFQTGVEINVPDLQADRTLSTTRKLIGLKAEVLPKVQPGGRIRLRVKVQHNRPSVSALDRTSIDGTSTETEVEVSPGQTISLGGAFIAGESEWVPSPIVRTLSEVVQLVNAVEEGRAPRRLDPSVVLKKTHDSETLFFISAEIVDSPAEQPGANPFEKERKATPLRKPAKNYLRDDLQYFPAGPEFKRPR